MANSVTFSRLGAGILALMGCVGIAVSAPPVGHDFNNDGFEDFPVGRVGYDEVTPETGAVRVWSGSDMTSLIDAIIPGESNTLFGWSLGSAGDINADGSADLIVGQPLWSVNGSYSGRIRVFSGADETELLVIDGPYIDTGLGRYVAGVGDWNGDGVPDIAASGWDIADTNQDGIGDDPVGIVYIFSGADGSQLAEIFEPTASPMFGFAVFGLGDINGDGLADVAVVDRGVEGAPGTGAHGSISIFTGRAVTGALALTDAHAIILNNDPTLRGFGAHVDTMHPDLWLAEPTLQVISLTDADVGGPNVAPTRVDILALDGQVAGSKGVRQTLVLAGDINLDGAVNATDLQASLSLLGTNSEAMGAMPIVDMNEDEIVDVDDVALVLNGYGGTTDIYEGLWNGGRLVSVFVQLPMESDPVSQLRTVWWRVFETPKDRLSAAQMTNDAQALLIRSAALRISTEPGGIAELIWRAKQDHGHIAAVGARDESEYITSEALARADLSFAWLGDPAQDQPRIQKIILYAIAFAAINAAEEDVALLQEPKFRYWDNTINFSYPEGIDSMDENAWHFMSRDQDGWSMPGGVRNDDRQEDSEVSRSWTRQARDMVAHDLVKAAIFAKLTDDDFGKMLSAFVSGKFNGYTLIAEVKDRIFGDPPARLQGEE